MNELITMAEPKKTGHDSVKVQSVTLGKDSRSLILGIADMKPVHQLALRLEVPIAGGGLVQEQVYMTINRLPEAE